MIKKDEKQHVLHRAPPVGLQGLTTCGSQCGGLIPSTELIKNLCKGLFSRCKIVEETWAAPQFLPAAQMQRELTTLLYFSKTLHGTVVSSNKALCWPRTNLLKTRK